MHLRMTEMWTGNVQNMYNMLGYTNDKKFTQ
jgi:hypothetical protein